MYTVEPGPFINDDPIGWSTAPSTTKNGKTVTRSTTPFAAIAVTGPTGQLSHPTVEGAISKYMFFGSNNYLLILDTLTDPVLNDVTHHVVLVNFTTSPPSERLILEAASRRTTNPPHVNYSRGTGSAFLLYAPTGDPQRPVTGIAIYRSDIGDVLCAANSSGVGLTQQITAELNQGRFVIKAGGQIISFGSCGVPAN